MFASWTCKASTSSVIKVIPMLALHTLFSFVRYFFLERTRTHPLHKSDIWWTLQACYTNFSIPERPLHVLQLFFADGFSSTYSNLIGIQRCVFFPSHSYLQPCMCNVFFPSPLVTAEASIIYLPIFSFSWLEKAERYLTSSGAAGQNWFRNHFHS
jgi:hypothetical protein